MTGTPQVRVGMAALAVAYSAEIGGLDQIDVDAMVTLAQQLLPSDDFLHRACTGFATQYEMHWRDPDVVARLGSELKYAVHLSNPDQAAPPVGAERSDLYG